MYIITISLSADFSTETLQISREWQDTFKMMEEKNSFPGILCPARPSFRFNKDVKNLIDTQKLREFITTKPDL